MEELEFKLGFNIKVYVIFVAPDCPKISGGQELRCSLALPSVAWLSSLFLCFESLDEWAE